MGEFRFYGLHPGKNSGYKKVELAFEEYTVIKTGDC